MKHPNKLNRSKHWPIAFSYREARQMLPLEDWIIYTDAYKKASRDKWVYS